MAGPNIPQAPMTGTNMTQMGVSNHAHNWRKPSFFAKKVIEEWKMNRNNNLYNIWMICMINGEKMEKKIKKITFFLPRVKFYQFKQRWCLFPSRYHKKTVKPPFRKDTGGKLPQSAKKINNYCLIQVLHWFQSFSLFCRAQLLTNDLIIK